MPLIAADSHDYELERVLLTQLVFHPKRIEIFKQVYAQLFYSDEIPQALRMFRAIVEANEESRRMHLIDATGYYVTTFLIQEQYTKLYGDKDVIQEIGYYFGDEAVSNAKNLPYEYVVRKLKELYWQRLNTSGSLRIAQLSKISPIDFDEIERQASAIIGLKQRILKIETDHTSVMVQRAATPDIVVKTHFDFIDNRIAGLTAPGISGLLAMPKHMKSSFCDNLIPRIVRQESRLGLIISLEDSVKQRLTRIYADHFDESLEEIRFGRKIILEENYRDMLEKVFGRKLVILDKRDVVTPKQAYDAIMDLQPYITAVDHLQKFELDDMVQGTIQAINLMENAAIKTTSHVLITSQVSDKTIAHREVKNPTASDAQWTSALLQSATEMFGLYYPYQLSKNIFQQHLIELEILAGRYSAGHGKIVVRIAPDKARFISEVIT